MGLLDRKGSWPLHLSDSLSSTDIPADLQALLLQWHLWLLFTKFVMVKVDHQLGQAWSAKHMCWFADDQTLRCEFSCLTGLEAVLRQISVVLAVVEDMGMKLSPQKSQVLLSMQGPER